MGEDDLIDRKKQQVEEMQRWLKLAPAPPEPCKCTYDAFISYRSSDRAWAMALYDLLQLAGWKPFLDQYALVPGADLETSLSEALEASSAGVILWSSRTKDSEWCKRERRAMMNLKDERGLLYVFAQLDSEALPVFARSDLYVNFEESPEGPRGVNLLKLMCGMRGVALTPEAVELALKVDQDAQQAMRAIKGAVEGGNAKRLLEIGRSTTPGMLASPAPVLAAAQGLISMGEYDAAREVLTHAQAHFPKSLRARQLEGLALRRLGKYQEAIDVLSELQVDGHQDPETLGILAAAWDGRYRETGKMLNLRKARELYRTAFQADPKSYYAGTNAASKSLFLGEAEEAARLAGAVFPLVEAASDAADFWAACSLAEVYLLQRNPGAAAAQYQKVIDRHSTKRGDLISTRQQAERICAAHKLSEADTKAVLTPFELLDG